MPGIFLTSGYLRTPVAAQGGHEGGIALKPFDIARLAWRTSSPWTVTARLNIACAALRHYSRYVSDLSLRTRMQREMTLPHVTLAFPAIAL